MQIIEPSNTRRSEALNSTYVAVVVHFNAPELLHESLENLFTQSNPPHHVFIVDNSASVATLNISDQFDNDVTVILSERNDGYGTAMNQARIAVNKAGAPWVLLMTQDLLMRPNACAELIDAGNRISEAICVAPLLFRRSNQMQSFSYGGRLHAGGRTTHLASLTSKQPYPVAWADGAALMVRHSALNAVNWLDEDYFLYYEEVDLCTRLRKYAGQNAVIMAPSAVAFQEPGNYTPYLRIRNHMLFWKKNFGGFRVIPAVIHQIARTGAKGALRQHQLSHIPWLLRGLIDGALNKTGQPPSTLFQRTRDNKSRPGTR